jgi:hypothetical protein
MFKHVKTAFTYVDNLRENNCGAGGIPAGTAFFVVF